MISTLIYSKDRACQLDCLLRSMKKYLPELDPYVVVYASNANYRTAYCDLSAELDIPIRFQDKMLNHFKNFLNNSRSENLFCLFTDDCIVFRRPEELFSLINYKETESFISGEKNFLPGDVWCLSMRLGLNTVVQDYNNNELLKKPKLEKYTKLVGSYDCTKYPATTNYGLHWSWDGVIYSTQSVLNVMSDTDFSDCSNPHACFPQRVENWMQNRRDLIGNKNKIAIEEQSSVICMNWNSTHPYAPFKKYTIEKLNTEYLNGKRIDFENMDFSNVNSCHQEFEIKWK